MKKIVIGALMIGLLAACGGAKDSYSYSDKVALSKKVMSSDTKAIKEYEKLIEEIKEIFRRSRNNYGTRKIKKN